MSNITSSVATTATTMVNAAFLQEVKDSNLQFWGNLHDLKRLLNESAVAQDQPTRLVSLLSELRDSMALEFSLEETYGYIDGSYSATSVSATKAARAKREHRGLYLQLLDLSEASEEAQYRGTIREDYRELVVVCKGFLTALDAHERHESELIRYELGIGRFGR